MDYIPCFYVCVLGKTLTNLLDSSPVLATNDLINIMK